MKFLLATLFVLTFNFSFSQMKVEDIKTGADALRFFKIFYPDSKSETVRFEFCRNTDTILLKDPVVGKFFDSAHGAKKWFTKDINNDGKLDLVFCGCEDDETQIVIFLSDTIKQSYRKVYAHRNFNFSHPFAYFNPDGKLILGDVSFLSDSGNHANYLLNIDTIVYSGHSLFEFNALKSFKDIDSLKITITAHFYYIRGQYLTVFNNGTVKLERLVRSEGHNVLQKYSSKKNDQAGKAMLYIAERLPFYKYKTQYLSDVDDATAWYTDIYFSDHSLMTILDVDIGPFGLKSIYQYADELFRDKKWKLVSAELQSSP